jgi:sterol 3beta-glucosyltransferase
LGLGLQRAGHQVTLVSDVLFADLVSSAGLEFQPVRVVPMQALQDDIRRMAGSPAKLVRWINANFKPVAAQFFRDLYAISEEAEGILYSSLAFASYHVAVKRGIPPLAVYNVPITPTRAFCNPSAFSAPAWLPFKGLYNWYSFRIFNQAYFWLLRPTANQCRQEVLGLPPLLWKTYARLDLSETPILYGYSAHVLPKPADWGDWLHVTGYWFMDAPEDWQPPADLLHFLEAGPPPVYVGFGSMVDQEAQDVTRMVVEALAHSGQRGVLLGGWANLGAGTLPDSIYRTENIPHDWLFPRMAAVVHHGGAGTTAAGLRAGKPSVIVPFFADQPFWAERVYRLGAGPQPILRKRLSVDTLVQAIRQAVADPIIRQKAAELGEKICAEDGVRNAVKLIEQYLQKKG